MKSPAMRPIVLTLLASLAGCATAPDPASSPARSPAQSPVSFVVVRHAEKADDGSRDPPLTESGAARARRLAETLQTEPVAAVYATAYRRTQQTVAAIAAAHGIPVTTYDATRSATDFTAQLRRRHATGTVLVAGHSNTVPAIAAALCGCIATALGDSDYGRIYRISIAPDGRAVLVESTLP